MGWTDRIPFLSQSSPSQPSSSPSPSPWDRLEGYHVSLLPPEFRNAIHECVVFSPTQRLVLVGCCAISLVGGYRLGRIHSTSRYFVRIASASDAPSALVGKNASYLRGRVVSVSDGDTVRFLHVPTIFHSSRVGADEKMSDVAMAVRICTIDTPETAKFGKPGQPFGDDAKEFLSKLVGGRMVQAKLLQKDQYGRAVAEVRVGTLRPFRKYVDEQMLKAGLAEVYQGGGAVYGRLGKERYLELEEEARTKKRGIWSLQDRESAAKYKERLKAGVLSG